MSREVKMRTDLVTLILLENIRKIKHDLIEIQSIHFLSLGTHMDQKTPLHPLETRGSWEFTQKIVFVHALWDLNTNQIPNLYTSKA